LRRSSAQREAEILTGGSRLRLFWRWKSRRPAGDPRFRVMFVNSSDGSAGRDPLWGAPRIHGELLKLGIEIAQSTAAKYMVRTVTGLEDLSPQSRGRHRRYRSGKAYAL
jgi:hypothetical protein